jgi:hypothetical protein
MSAHFSVVLLCAGIAIGRSTTQGILPKYVGGFIVPEVNSEYGQVRGSNPRNVELMTVYGSGKKQKEKQSRISD